MIVTTQQASASTHVASPRGGIVPRRGQSLARTAAVFAAGLVVAAVPAEMGGIRHLAIVLVVGGSTVATVAGLLTMHSSTRRK